jgi:pyrimidine operon attenuation protein/uracil phosphoribosyltransferase
MNKINSQNIILDCFDVENKIKRISLEILEDNTDQEKLIFFGVSKNGKIIAKKIIDYINQNSKIESGLVGVDINSNSNKNLAFDKEFKTNNLSLVIVSDVSQSARTLQIIISHLMLENPFKIKTAVMVNRDHSLFPVKINFSGLNLSTSVNERVDVEVNKDGEFTVYLN